MSLPENLVQKRWKVLREKFSNAYRKEMIHEIECNWPLYGKLRFLEPFINIKDPKPVFYRSEPKSQVAPSPMDEFVLIDLIKQYPILYDKKHEDFRSASCRLLAWEEIASKCHWDVITIQKRWRVLRDRFVRELRRTQENGNGDSTCGTFFREMLFLANHVRSKRYEIEADLTTSDSKITDSEDDSQKEWVLEENDDFQETANELDDESASYQYINEDGEDVTETEVLGEEDMTETEYIEDDFCEGVEELTTVVTEDDGGETQQIWLKDEASRSADTDLHISSVSRKRRASSSDDFQEQPKPKLKSESQSTSRTTPDMNVREEMDEDMAFGNTIGCMLKKIPANLKTAVKLKLLSSLAEFEAMNKLV